MFKRISDVYLEKFKQALVELGGDPELAAFAENHRFTIPDEDLLSDVRKCREIEKANLETLYGIFGNANWTNEDKLPDRKLADLIRLSRRKRWATRTLPPDMFGNA